MLCIPYMLTTKINIFLKIELFIFYEIIFTIIVFLLSFTQHYLIKLTNFWVAVMLTREFSELNFVADILLP